MMALKKAWQQFAHAYDERKRSDRLVIAIVALGLVAGLYTLLVYDVQSERLDNLQRQQTTLDNRLTVAQARLAAAEIARDRDPVELRERLQQVAAEQLLVDREIASMAGSLVTPEAMTRLLTSVLTRQPGLQMVRVENRPPVALRGPGEGTPLFRHGLSLELEGDFLTLLQYLRQLEQLPQRFFWDALQFEQAEWPRARVRLELHTLSPQEGFIGV